MSSVTPLFIPESFEVLSRPKRIKVFFGGRNSTKTETFGRQIMLNMESSLEPYNVVCARMFLNSIEESAYSMLKTFNDEYDFGYDDRANKITNHRNGSKVTFAGLSRNIKSIKSKFRPTVFWVDEADDVSDQAWKVIIPTFRESNSEIWITFNPEHEMDATYQRFVTPYLDTITKQGFYEDDDIYVRLVNHDENPFLSDVSKREIEQLKKTNFKEYLHIYEGEPNGSFDDAIIEPEWVEAAIDAHIKLGFKPTGERVASLDVADEGSDAKAYGERYGVVVTKAKQWDDGDLTDCIDSAFEEAEGFRADNLVYDNIGVGAGVKVYLKTTHKKARFTIDGFGGSDGVDDPDEVYGYDESDARLDRNKDQRTNKDTFKNKRAQYYWYLRDRFFKTYQAVEKGVYIDPDELISLSSDLENLKQLKHELIRIPRKRVSGSRVIQIMSKMDMKKLGIKSPNLADMLMMMFANSAEDFHYVPEVRAPTRRR